jgi:hypothetical protein
VGAAIRSDERLLEAYDIGLPLVADTREQQDLAPRRVQSSFGARTAARWTGKG